MAIFINTFHCKTFSDVNWIEYLVTHLFTKSDTLSMDSEIMVTSGRRRTTARMLCWGQKAPSTPARGILAYSNTSSLNTVFQCPRIWIPSTNIPSRHLTLCQFHPNNHYSFLSPFHLTSTPAISHPFSPALPRTPYPLPTGRLTLAYLFLPGHLSLS